MLSEKAIIQKTMKGDRQAQRLLYERYAGAMYAICLRYAKSTLEAEDILQESFVKVFNSISKFNNKAKLSTWITRIVINTALNSERSKLYLYPMVDVEDIGQQHYQSVNLDRYSFEELLTMVRTLPDGCRIVFNLYAIEGYTHKEIAAQLNISEGTSKSQFSRARKLLKELIEQENKMAYEQAR